MWGHRGCLTALLYPQGHSQARVTLPLVLWSKETLETLGLGVREGFPEGTAQWAWARHPGVP